MRSSPGSICCVRPSAAPKRKHHQIRAYILLIKVIAVRHQQIRVAFCQVDSITVVKHLVRGFPQSKTQVSRFFHYTGSTNRASDGVRIDVVRIEYLKGPYNANSTFIVLLYVHMRSWHVSQPTNA